MNFSYATLATLQDANGKKTYKRYRKLLATTCITTVSRCGYAKHRLAKFKGIFLSVATVATAGKLSKENFLLHLKECEFRYNTKTTQENLYQKLLKLIRENPLNLS